MERDDFPNAMDRLAPDFPGKSTRRPIRRFVLRSGGAGLALLTLLSSGAGAQSGDTRSSFPGRRVGGGTRGDCTSRMLAHLVPTDSVYATDGTGLVGILQGPARDPRPVELSFRPYGGAPGSGGERTTRSLTLPADPVGVTLLRLPTVTRPTVWESRYRCEEAAAETADPLSFVVSTVPPVVSLLMRTDAPTPADRGVQKQLGELRALCGNTVSTVTLGKAFGMEDLMATNWPAELPVRCPEAAAALP